MYYGEEIGMETTTPSVRKTCRTRRTHWLAQRNWPRRGAHSHAVETATNAGFTRGKPWLPVPPSYQSTNVASEVNDPSSILNFYKRVLALRHNNEALREGKYVALNPDDANVLSYLRQYKNSAVLVALNMSATPQKVAFDLTPQGFASATLRPLASSNAPTNAGSAAAVELQPFGVYVAEVQAGAAGAGQPGK